MRIDLFKLNIPEDFNLAARLRAIYCNELVDRNRDRGGQTLRLETIEQRRGFWLCDFVKVRLDHGPGRAGRGEPIKGFDLAEDEGFGEETALLWDPKTNYCLIQYNHYGPRESAIAEYIALWDHQSPVDFEFIPKLDDSIHAKLRSKKIVRKFSLSVAPKRLSNNDYKNNISLGQGIKALGTVDADTITITVSVTGKRSKSLGLSLMNISDWIQNVGGGSEDSPVLAARAAAKGAEKETSEVLDLLHHRMTTDKALASGPDRRYPQGERWNALERAYTDWKNIINP